MPSRASRGLVSDGAFASNSGNTLSAQSAAQNPTRRRSSSLIVIRPPPPPLKATLSGMSDTVATILSAVFGVAAI